MTVEIAAFNDLEPRFLGPKARTKLIAERGFKLAVDNAGNQAPLFVKVIASLQSPREIAKTMTSKEEILLAVCKLYDALPYQLRHTDPLDGQWLPRHVSEPRPDGVQVDGRIGMLSVQPANVQALVKYMGQATMAGLAFCEALRDLGWHATHTVRLIRHQKHEPPDWLISACTTNRYTLNVEIGNIMTRA